MEFEEFRKEFIENVRSKASTTGDGYTATFAAEVGRQLVDAEVLPDYFPSFYKGRGSHQRKMRIDGYAYDDFESTMNIILADCESVEEAWTLTRTKADRDFKELRTFLEMALESTLYRDIEESTPCSDFIDLLRKECKAIRKYRFFVLTDGSLSETITDIDEEPYDGIPIEANIWDLRRVYRVASSALGHEPVEIDFAEFTEHGLPCIEASNATTSEYRSYLGVIPGEVLADIYDTYQGRLLEGNVRSFLSVRGKVNKAIRATILNAPEKFFAFNNGISVTATDVHIEHTEQGQFITRVRDFQIINGGQTTASLSDARYRYRNSADLSRIYVQMKLTEIDDSDAEATGDLILDIARSSNSQNKVTEADFFSSHPFHRRMEQFSRKIYAPAEHGAQYETLWFYERARGSYDQAQMHLGKKERKQFLLQHPKAKRIRKIDLAKAVNAWWGHPEIVSEGAQKNFTTFAKEIGKLWDADAAQFNEHWYKKMIALLIIFRRLEKAIPQQSWYENGYRANIIYYTIALFRRLIARRHRNRTLDFLQIWNAQDVPEPLLRFLLQIGEQVLATITNPKRRMGNVTQWCKKPACWASVQTIDLPLPADIDNCLISVSEELGEAKEAQKIQRQAEDVKAQTAVAGYGAEVWKHLYFTLKLKKRIHNASDVQAFEAAKKLPENCPNPEQSRRLLALLQEEKDEGFRI